MRSKFSNLIWGVCLLLAAAFVLTNKFIGYANIGIGSIVVAILALAFIVQCLARLHIAPLVIPVAVLYFIFREPLGLPVIQTWKLIAAAALAFIGLNMLIPHGRRSCNQCNNSGGSGDQQQNKIPADGNKDNNPYVGVNFGAVSRSLNADSLETLRLSCNFGAMEIYLNQVQLSPNGAEVDISCSFGGIQLFVPQHWQVIDRMHCTLGGVNIRSFTAPADNAPRLTLNGSVSLGGVEVKYM
jgi:predicted membrane protein